jgi:excisionase family DNA binding protein
MNNSPLSVPIPDACRIVGIGRTLLYQEIAAGRIQARKAGRKTLIPVESLHAWLNALPDALALQNNTEFLIENGSLVRRSKRPVHDP